MTGSLSGSGTGGAFGRPFFYFGNKFLMRHGHGSSSFTGIPTPEHERRVHVLHNLIHVAVAILARILEQLA